MSTHKLANRVRIAWLTPIIAFLFFVWALGIIIVGLQGGDFNIAALGGVHALFALLALTAIIGVPAWAWAELEYAFYSYEIKDREFVIHRGIFTRQLIIVPYEKISDVETSRNPVERLLGLVSIMLILEGRPDLQIAIPGVKFEERQQLIESLRARMHAAKHGVAYKHTEVKDEEASALQKQIHELRRDVIELKRQVEELQGERKSKK